MTTPPSWASLPLPGLADALAADAAGVAVALADGRLFHSRDAGATWKRVADRDGTVPTVLRWVGGGLLVGTTVGLVRVATGSSERHLARGLPAGLSITALAARGSVVVAGTLRAGVFRSGDGGRRWEASRAGLPLGGDGLRIFAAAATPQGFAVAHGLGVSRSHDEGRTWAPSSSGLPLRLPRATLVPTGPALYAVADGRLYRAAAADAQPETWVEVYDGTPDGYSVDLLGGGEGVLYAAAPRPPYVVASANDGATWHGIARGFPCRPRSLAVAAPWLFGLAADGTLWRLPRGATAAALLRAHRPADLSLRVQASRPDEPLVLLFILGTATTVRLTIQNELDAHMTLVAEAEYGAGAHSIRIAPGTFAAGFYRCRLRAGRQSRAASFALLA